MAISREKKIRAHGKIKNVSRCSPWGWPSPLALFQLSEPIASIDDYCMDIMRPHNRLDRHRQSAVWHRCRPNDPNAKYLTPVTTKVADACTPYRHHLFD